MSGIRVKETMEQIHIPEEMQERIIRNLQERMQGEPSIEDIEERPRMETGYQRLSAQRRHPVKSGRSRTREGSGNGPRRDRFFRAKKAAIAASIVLAAGIAAIPAQAIVRSFVMARMEALPKEEVKDIADLLQAQRVEADSFSRDFSDSEDSRMTELWRLYRVGRFPEGTIRLVEREEEMPEGVFCYVFETGYFYLPQREMTDEELLQIIDFNMLRNYVLSQTPAGQEARREQLTRQDRLKRRVADEGGISQEEAEAIAAAKMESQPGLAAGGTKYSYVYLEDISKEDYAHKSDVAYIVVLQSAEGGAPYVCRIDSADGSVLEAGENLPYARHVLDQ